MSWKRINYLLHRWTGIVLGVIMLVWFVSGIAMLYYPYPGLSASERLNALAPIRLDSAIPPIDFATARNIARSQARDSSAELTARLARWNDRLVYALYSSRGSSWESVALVDAGDGSVVSPINAAQAREIARRAIGPARAADPITVELLPRSDHYFMGNEKKGSFPVFRVRFGDHEGTAVYIAVRTGEAVAVVNRLARWTTWIGAVPHWLYFESLYYDHFDAWLWLNILLPGAAMVIALTGMVLGVLQLLPKRWRGSWRISAYHGVSLWHHVAGVTFGALVFTWTLSGMLEVLGPSATPSAQVQARARGDGSAWRAPTLDVVHAVGRASAISPGETAIAVDFERSEARAGYVVHFRSGRRVWIDAITGAVRRQIDSRAAADIAGQLIGRRSEVAAVELRTTQDAFYYSAHDRAVTLPAWRVRFRDAPETTIYLDPVTGIPTAVVDNNVRRWRWWRDGLHDFDFPALAGRRPLWDVLVLTLMLGGLVSSVTGVWLLGRRLWRLRPGL